MLRTVIRTAVIAMLAAVAFGAGDSCRAATFGPGWTHNLYVTPARQVWAWGSNDYGKLGNATSVSSSVPVRAGSLTDVVAVAAGDSQSLAVRADGTVWSWGAGAGAPETCVLYDQIGNSFTRGCSKVPRQVAGIAGAVGIAAGGSVNLVLLADGTLRQFSNFSAPATVGGISSVMAVAAGDVFFMALRSDGTVWTWGAGGNGELGTGAVTPQMCIERDTYTGEPANRPCAGAPAMVPGLSGVVAIAAGGRHALALRSDGTVRTWGSNHYGQMGDGTTNNRFTPYAIPGLTNVTQVATGFNHSLALRSDGTLWAWGMNNHGQLGMAATHSCVQAGRPSVPCNRGVSQASGHSGARSIVAGGAHSIAVRPDGALDAFGLNHSGQLGYGVPGGGEPASPGGIDPHKFEFESFAPTVPSGASLGTTTGSGGLDLDAIDNGLSFGAQAVGTSSAVRELRFSNLQSVAIAVGSIVASGDFSRTHNCPASLPANGSCNISVTFRPTTDGQRLGSLTITTNAPDAPTIAMALHGVGGTAATLAQAQNHSDIWWNPGESGWGITIADHETAIFAVWYTYEASGKPTWFTIPGGALSPDRRYLSGELWSTTGPCYSAATFNPSLVVPVRRGTAHFDFAPADLPAGWARFTGSIGTASWSKAIRRMEYGNAAPNWGSDYTDIWWNPAQSGWGLTLAQHGNNIFGVLFTYDCDGSPLFATLPGVAFSTPAQFAGDFYTTRSSGSWYGSATFNPSHITATRVGSGSLSFAGSSGTFAATINASTRTSPIAPQPFGNRAPGTP